MTSRLLLLGAGRSASSLIHYILRHAPTERWFLTVADANPAHLVPVLAAHSEYARAVPFDLSHEAQLDELVAQADVVISMLPAALHLAVAQACVRHGRHLATAMPTMGAWPGCAAARPNRAVRSAQRPEG